MTNPLPDQNLDPIPFMSLDDGSNQELELPMTPLDKYDLWTLVLVTDHVRTLALGSSGFAFQAQHVRPNGVFQSIFGVSQGTWSGTTLLSGEQSQESTHDQHM
jgi:hypothetical protein